MGLENMLDAIAEVIDDSMRLIEMVIPYSDAGKIQGIRKYGQLLAEEYQGEGIYVKAKVPNNIYLDL